jgi:hypothetical protein
MAIDAHSNLLVGQTVSRIQDQPRPLHITKRQRRRLRPLLKLGTILSRQLDRITAGPRHEDLFAAPPAASFT